MRWNAVAGLRALCDDRAGAEVCLRSVAAETEFLYSRELESGAGKSAPGLGEWLADEVGHDVSAGGAGRGRSGDEQLNAWAGDVFCVGLGALGENGSGRRAGGGEIGEVSELESGLMDFVDGGAVRLSGDGGNGGGLRAEAERDADAVAGMGGRAGRGRLVEDSVGRNSG